MTDFGTAWYLLEITKVQYFSCGKFNIGPTGSSGDTPDSEDNFLSCTTCNILLVICHMLRGQTVHSNEMFHCKCNQENQKQRKSILIRVCLAWCSDQVCTENTTLMWAWIQ